MLEWFQVRAEGRAGRRKFWAVGWSWVLEGEEEAGSRIDDEGAPPLLLPPPLLAPVGIAHNEVGTERVLRNSLCSVPGIKMRDIY